VPLWSARDSIRRLCLVGELAMLTALACAAPLAPIVDSRPIAPRDAALKKVAVAPLVASPSPEGSFGAGSSAPPESTSLVAGFLSQALAARGISVVTPREFGELPAGPDGGPPDPLAAAKLAADRFGATGVLLGTLQRYRDLEGSRRSTSSPASVAFQVTLYAAPSGKKLWTARFNETQHSLNERPLDAARYPGGGTRWLTAAELARWGADATVQSLAEGS
jgi:hypothetical protein